MTPDTSEVREAVARVLPEIRARAAEHDETAMFPSDSLKALRGQGLMGLLVPAEYGGTGADLHTFTRVAGQLAGACLSTAQIWAMHNFQVDALVRHATPELKQDLLPRIARGEVYIASVTTEPGASASLFTASSAALADGEKVRFDRLAPVVTGGAHADGFLITLRSSSEASEHDVSTVYADRTDVTAEVSGRWDTLGMRATESVGMRLVAAVPAHHVVARGREHDVLVRDSLIPVSHLGWSACWLGAARGALRELVRWLSRSGRFSDGGPSDLQQERLGRIRMDLELVGAYLSRFLEETEQTRAAQNSPPSGPHQILHANTLKVAASELTYRAVDAMVQLAGLGVGYRKGGPLPLERHLRDLRAASLNHGNDKLVVGVGGLSLLDRSVTLL